MSECSAFRMQSSDTLICYSLLLPSNAQMRRNVCVSWCWRCLLAGLYKLLRGTDERVRSDAEACFHSSLGLIIFFLLTCGASRLLGCGEQASDASEEEFSGALIINIRIQRAYWHASLL